MKQTIDGAAFRRMILSAAANVEKQKQQINELNVFPVPDGDTGTNMSMTLSAAAAELGKLPEQPTLGKAASVTSGALLRGARGNSGVILSLLFRGFTKVFRDCTECTGTLFAQALQEGVENAYKAVMRPAEGTILTVSRLTAAAAAEEAKKDDSMEHLLEVCIETARKTVAATTAMNPVLKKAGVVDAGGQGYLAVLEGMLASLQGSDITSDAPQNGDGDSVFAAFSTEEITFAFDTVFILRRRPDVSLDPLRAYLSSIGDSLVIGEDEDACKIHVHTNIPGEALTEAQKYGTLELAKIENMRTQHEELASGQKAQSTDDLEKAPEEPRKPFAVVSVCAGEGLSAVFRDLGVDGIISGGQTMNPSTEDILDKIRQANAETVFVLPNNKNIIMAANQAAQLADCKVLVIETKTVPQGITAMLNFDPEAEPETNRENMQASLSGVSTMQITYAARNSDFDGRDIHEGEYLGLYNGALTENSSELFAVVRLLAEKARDEEKEFLTVFYGEDADEAGGEAVARIFREICPSADVNVVNGGQPVYYYLISAE